jgi:hypothetical protein
LGVVIGAGWLIASFVHGGPEGGPKPDLLEIKPYQTVSQQLSFRGGELATVIASSRGSSDVDLYVFDESGNVVAWDDNPLDAGAAEWIPERGSRFAYVVRNTGPSRDIIEILVR